MITLAMLLGLSLAVTCVFVGCWVLLEMPSPIKGHFPKKCDECGKCGWGRVREDAYTEHKKCLRCGWISHFNKLEGIGHGGHL